MRLPIRLFLVPTLFLFVAASAHAQTPTLVHSKSLSTSGENGNNFKIVYGGSMGTGTLAGNLLTLRMTYPHGATLSSISDNKSSTYTLGVSVDSGSWVTVLYYVAGAPAGITQITVSFTSSTADWHAALQEFSGVATTSPADGTCSSGTAAPATVQCDSAIVTSTAGDLVVPRRCSSAASARIFAAIPALRSSRAVASCSTTRFPIAAMAMKNLYRPPRDPSLLRFRLLETRTPSTLSAWLSNPPLPVPILPACTSCTRKLCR